MSTIFDKIGQAISNIGQNVTNAANTYKAVTARVATSNPAAARILGRAAPMVTAGARVVSGVTTSISHPKYLVGDVLNAITLPAQYTAKAVGYGLQGIGQATGHIDLVKAGSSVLRVTREVDVAAERDPIAAGEIVGGAVVTVVGAVTGGVLSTAGIALMAKGTALLTNDVIKAEKEWQSTATEADRGGVWGVPPSNVGSPSIFTPPAPPHDAPPGATSTVDNTFHPARAIGEPPKPPASATTPRRAASVWAAFTRSV